jgi:hypothetical protein
MLLPISRFATVAVLALALAGCNRNASETAPQAEEAPIAAPAEPVAEAPALEQAPEIPPNTETEVSAINSVMLSRPPDAPDAVVIRASGFTATPGWSDPKLMLEEDTSGDTSIRTYRFVATSPETPQTGEEQPVDTELRIDSLPAEVKTIRIVSATNEVAAPVTQ